MNEFKEKLRNILSGFVTREDSRITEITQSLLRCRKEYTEEIVKEHPDQYTLFENKQKIDAFDFVLDYPKTLYSLWISLLEPQKDSQLRDNFQLAIKELESLRIEFLEDFEEQKEILELAKKAYENVNKNDDVFNMIEHFKAKEKLSIELIKLNEMKMALILVEEAKSSLLSIKGFN